MTPRREAILQAIVEEYIETAQPVGSLMLTKKYNFPYSSATVRAEMALLEEEGYIVQPHTSAGRIPTEKGYRYFVNMIQQEERELARREETSLRHRLEAIKSGHERLLNMATLALSELSGNVALATYGGEVYTHGLARMFRQPEFSDTSRVLRVADLIDNLPYLLRELPKSQDFMIFIGSESPVGKAAGCSLVISKIETSFNVPGYVGVLGPMRMSYSRIIPLVQKTKLMLEEEM